MMATTTAEKGQVAFRFTEGIRRKKRPKNRPAPQLPQNVQDGPLWRSFREFHELNPWVFERLVDICFELKRRGFSKYSMRTLVSVLRFEWDLKTSGDNVVIGGEEKRVKLNDHHTPYYARYLVQQYPEFKSFFEFRRAEGE